MSQKKAVRSSVQSSSGTGAVDAGSSIITSPVVTPVITGVGAGIGTSSTVSTLSSSGGAPVVAPKGFRLQLSQMLAGWEQVIPTGAGIPSRGGTLVQATVLGQLTAFMADYTAVDVATLALKAVRQQEQSDLPAAKLLIAQLKEALTAFLGASSPQLARFGMKPKAKAKARSAAQVAVAVARGASTRAIRGTTGKLEKAELKSGPIAVSFAATSYPVAPSSAGPAAQPSASPAVVSGPPIAGK